MRKELPDRIKFQLPFPDDSDRSHKVVLDWGSYVEVVAYAKKNSSGQWVSVPNDDLTGISHIVEPSSFAQEAPTLRKLKLRIRTSVQASYIKLRKAYEVKVNESRKRKLL